MSKESAINRLNDMISIYTCMLYNGKERISINEARNFLKIIKEEFENKD